MGSAFSHLLTQRVDPAFGLIINFHFKAIRASYFKVTYKVFSILLTDNIVKENFVRIYRPYK